MSIGYDVWIVSRCGARGLGNVWRYLDEFADHKPGRLHRSARPDLLVSVPCQESHAERCIERGGAADIALEATGDDAATAAAYSLAGAAILDELGWSAATTEAAPRPPGSEGADRVRQLAAEGRLVPLPAPMDSSTVRYVMAQQEFHVLEAMVISHDLCTGCRLCESVCPARALERVDGRIRMTGECVAGACGLCYMACPQMLWQLGLVRNPDSAPVRPAPMTQRQVRGSVAAGVAELVALLERRHAHLRTQRFDTERMGPGFLARCAKEVRRAEATVMEVAV